MSNGRENGGNYMSIFFNKHVKSSICDNVNERHMKRLKFHVVVAILVVESQAVSAQTKSVRDGVYSDAQAKRGLSLYRSECSRCHGDGLLGSESGPALLGSAFLAPWQQKSVADFFALTRDTMPQDSPGRLTAAQYVDIVAYVLMGNGFPSGPSDLPSDAAKLLPLLFPSHSPCTSRD